MSATSASKSPATSGSSATSTALPPRSCPESSHASSFETSASASKGVCAGSLPIARSGIVSSPFTAASPGSDTVHR